MMRKKSFGKLALVLTLAALMLFGLCVCSKSSGSSAESTTAQTAATTQTSTAQSTAKTAAGETKVETSAVETKVETPAQEVKTEEVKVEEPVVEVKAEEPVEEVKVEEPAAEVKAEEPVEEVKAEESTASDEDLTISEDGTISGTYEYGDFASASFVMEGSKAVITYPANYIYKEDIDAFMALCLEMYPDYLSSVSYAVPEDGTLEIYYPEEYVGGLTYRLGVLDYLNSMITSYIDSYVESVIAQAGETETVEETAEVEEEKPFKYTYVLDYKGVRAEINAYTTYAEISVPEGMTAQDVATVASLLSSEYPQEAALVTYALDGDRVTLTYPEQSSDFVIAVVDTLRDQAVALIDTLVPDYSVEEAVPAEDHLYAETLSYKGLSTTIVVDNTEATITVPEGVEKDDVDVIAQIVAAVYPNEASLVTYSFDDGVLSLTYPEQSDEYLLSILDTLKEGGMYLADLYGEVEETEEQIEEVVEAVETAVEVAEDIVEGFDLVVEEDGTIRATFNYHDMAYAQVVVEDDKLSITYPREYVAKADIDAFMAEMVNAYGSYLENVYYDVPEDGLLVIYFPSEYVGGTYYRLAVLDELDEDVTAYIDALVAELQAETEELETKLEEVAAEESHVYSDTLTYKGVTSTVVVDSTSASFTIPEGMSDEDLASVVWFVNYLYPAEASLLTYTVEDGVITIYYPEQSDEFLSAALTVLRDEAMALIDQLPAEEETVVVAEVKEEPVEEVVEAAEEPVYAETLVYKNVETSVAVYSTYSTFTVPEGMSSADILAVADMINAAYPAEASLVTYSLDNGVLTLYYPEQSDAFLVAALDVIREEGMALIDEIEEANAPVVKAETVEEAPAEEAAAPVETAPAVEPVAPVAAVEPVAEPVAQKTSALNGFSIAATASPKYILNGDKGFDAGFGVRFEKDFGAAGIGLKAEYDIKKYIQAGAYGKYSFVSTDKFDVYGLVGAGVSIGLGSDSAKVSALVEAGLGFDYRLTDSFSLFAEVLCQYSFNANPGIGLGATIGAKYSF